MAQEYRLKQKYPEIQEQLDHNLNGNKEYNPQDFSGMGRVYLDKNVKAIGGLIKNWLEQSMLNRSNTIYVIQDEFYLGEVAQQAMTFSSDFISSVKTAEKKELEEATTAYNDALSEYQDAVQEYNEDVAAYESAVDAYNAAKEDYESDPTPAKKDAMDAANEVMLEAEERKENAEAAKETAEVSLQEKQEAKQKAQSRYAESGNQDFYYYIIINIEAHHSLHLSGRAVVLNEAKTQIVETGRTIVGGDSGRVVCIGNYAGSYSYRYDSCITIPDNSVLQFSGGSINDGTIHSNDRYVVESGVKCFGNIKFAGDSKLNLVADLRWFVDRYPVNTSDTSVDNTEEVRQCLTCGARSVLFPTDKFVRLTETIVINETVNILADVNNNQLITYNADRDRGLEIPSVFSEMVVTLFEFHIGAYNGNEIKYNGAFYIGPITLVTRKEFNSVSLDPSSSDYRETPVLYIDNKYARNTSWGVTLDCNVGAVAYRIEVPGTALTQSACNWTGIDVRTAVNPYTYTDHAIAFLEINGDLFNLGMGFVTRKTGTSFFNDVIFRGHSECAFGCDNGAGGVLMVYGSNQVKYMPPTVVTQYGYFKSKTVYLFGWVWDADGSINKSTGWTRAKCKVESTIEAASNNFWPDYPIAPSDDYRCPNPMLTGKRITGNVDLGKYPNILYNGLSEDEANIIKDLQYDIMFETEDEFVPSLHTDRIVNGHCLFNDDMMLLYYRGSGLPAVEKTSMDIAYATEDIKKVRVSFTIGNYYRIEVPTFLLIGCWNYKISDESALPIKIYMSTKVREDGEWKWKTLYDSENPLLAKSYRYTNIGYFWKFDLNHLGASGRETAITIEIDYSAMQNTNANKILPFICVPWYYSGVPKLRHCLPAAFPHFNGSNRGWSTFDDADSKPVWWNGNKWVNGDGFNAFAKRRGTTAERPVGGTELNHDDIGFEYFDTNLNAPIYAEAINEETGEIVWTDSNGCIIDYASREIVALMDGYSVSEVLDIRTYPGVETDEEFMERVYVEDINGCLKPFRGFSAGIIDASTNDLIYIQGVGTAYRRMWYVIDKNTRKVTSLFPEESGHPSDAYISFVKVESECWIVVNVANEECERQGIPYPYSNDAGTPFKIVHYSKAPAAKIPDYGTMANRPSLDETNIGFQYFATDVGDYGKPIYWSGTAWVDSVGELVDITPVQEPEQE